MVRAIREGRKTQTRRIAIPRYDDKKPCVHWSGATCEPVMTRHCEHGSEGTTCPYGQPGDRLWVKETFLYRLQKTAMVYRADLPGAEAAGVGGLYGGWKPSIFMPRKFSRTTLDVVSVKVEQLQSISREDAMAEGIYLNENDYWTAGEMEPGKILAGLDCPQAAYGRLWEYINGAGSWLVNPWVWAVTFMDISNK